MTDPNTTDILLIDTQDRVRTLTLNRPQARNALSSALRTQFFGALRDAEADDSVDVVILTVADALRAGLVTEVVPHDELLATARRIAASIVGNNQNAVQALLASYHRIDDA